MQSQASRVKSKAQLTKTKIFHNGSVLKRGKAKSFTGHPDLELAKEASKIHTMKDDVREQLLHDAHSPFALKGNSFAHRVTKWAKGNRIVSIPLSILAGVVTTAIVRAVIGPKNLKNS